MNQNISTSNEIDSVLTDMSRRDFNLSSQASDTDSFKPAVRAGLYASYIPPYRATYMQAHNIEP